MIIGGIVAGSGSSPLARGTYQANTTAPVVARFIPARAGNPLRPSVRVRCRWAHLRSRGEHVATGRAAVSVPGSSPLARGTHTVVVAEVGGVGLIPARAGNTLHCSGEIINSSAHPRSRGEHGIPAMKPPEEYGSSPLARGTRLRCRVLLLCRRLIPARAGNTDNPKAAAAYRAAHPRSRGEHVSIKYTSPAWHGSSPLARGTRS